MVIQHFYWAVQLDSASHLQNVHHSSLGFTLHCLKLWKFLENSLELPPVLIHTHICSRLILRPPLGIAQCVALVASTDKLGLSTTFSSNNRWNVTSFSWEMKRSLTDVCAIIWRPCSSCCFIKSSHKCCTIYKNNQQFICCFGGLHKNEHSTQAMSFVHNKTSKWFAAVHWGRWLVQVISFATGHGVT